VTSQDFVMVIKKAALLQSGFLVGIKKSPDRAGEKNLNIPCRIRC